MSYFWLVSTIIDGILVEFVLIAVAFIVMSIFAPGQCERPRRLRWNRMVIFGAVAIPAGLNYFIAQSAAAGYADNPMIPTMWTVNFVLTCVFGGFNLKCD